MQTNIYLILAFVLYLGSMMMIGVYFYRRTRNMSDYILGNRKLGAWVTSLSAEASDMSGWMLMGLPGYVAGGKLVKILPITPKALFDQRKQRRQKRAFFVFSYKYL